MGYGGIRNFIGVVSKKSTNEIKTKMEQKQWLQLKMLFLLGSNLKIVIWWGWGGGGELGGWGNWLLGAWENENLVGGIFLGGWWARVMSPPHLKLPERVRSLKGESCCIYIYYSKAKAFLKSFSESSFKFLKSLYCNFQFLYLLVKKRLEESGIMAQFIALMALTWIKYCQE